MRRWVGIGAVLAVLVAALGYVLEPQWGGSTPGDDGTDTRTEEDAPARPLPVSTLLGAPLPSARGDLSITGTVLGLDGSPVAGAVVVATAPTPDETLSELPCPCEGESESEKKLSRCDCDKKACLLMEHVAERQGEAPPHARTTSDAQGRFSLEGLEAGTYALWADGSFGTVLRRNVPAGSEELVLRVGPGMLLSGRVRDEDGHPVARALVTALLVEPSRFFDTLTDAEGHWRLGPLPEEGYNLVVSQPGFVTEHLRMSRMRTSSSLTLYRPVRLSGRVVRESRPVAGAHVHAAGGLRERDASTDAEGRFTLEGLRAGTYEVSATHAGLDALRSIELEPGMDTEGVLLELGTHARVTGTVRDPDGQPIAGASVWVRSQGSSETTRTASDGTYTLGPIPPGAQELLATAPRYQTSSSTVNVTVAPPATQDLTLAPVPVLQGRVVSATGQPLAGVRLELEADDPGQEEHRYWMESTSSEEDGTFVLETFGPAGYRLRASHDGFLPADQTVRAPSTGVQVVLRTGAHVEGEAVDEQERPVPLARVLLKPTGTSQGGDSGEARESSTDERGRFTLQGLRPGGYLVSVWSETGEEARTITRPIAVRGTEALKVRLQLHLFEGMRLSGLVVDGAGKPIPDALVVLQSEEDLEDPEHVEPFRREVPARTGADGRFGFRHLAAGRWWLWARAEGHRFDPVANGLGRSAEEDGTQRGIAFSASATDVRIVLEKLARLRGRVVRPDGSPVTRFWIDEKQVVDPQGAFALPFSGSRKVTLSFTAAGLAGTAREVELTEGVDTELGEVVLTPGREVRGRVVDAATGSPVAGAKVSVGDDPKDPERNLYSSRSDTTTARDGTFTLSHIQERPLVLGVKHPEFLSTRLALAPGQAEVTVALDAGATLQGEVALSNGRPWEVSVSSSPDTSTKSTRVLGNRYELRGLSAGTYVVFLQPSSLGEYPRAKIAPRQVEIPAHGVTVLDFKETPAQATLRLTGTPVPGAQLFLVAGSIPLPDSARALDRLEFLDFARREPGTAIFQGVPAGHYTLIVQASVNGAPLWHREELDLPGEGEVTHELSPQWVGIPGLELPDPGQ